MTDVDTTQEKTHGIQKIILADEMRHSYLDYAMSVIVARALPDVRDGLKPVHRRILYHMKQSGLEPTRSHVKSAQIVGAVIGFYHPHGDVAVYEAMVRLGQSFSMRLPLVDGQGNFGSMDGDKAAAYRYTEARLAKGAMPLLQDIDEETVDFRPNYDESRKEPVVLPAMYPNLLVNGMGGIAVGMATNIPPHNLGEVLDACCALLDNPQLEDEELFSYVKGPDFPTGGEILGSAGFLEVYRTGRGSVYMRAKTHVETDAKGREKIVVTEIPYQVNKSRLLERIAEVCQEKIVEGISDLRDESNREGVRVVVELKRDASADVVLNLLYKHTPLQTSFGVQMLAIHNGQPKMMTLREVLTAFLEFRREVVIRRTRFRLRKARERSHILIGLAVCVANIDPVIQLIKTSSSPQEAKERLMAQEWPSEGIRSLIELVEGPNAELPEIYHLSESQARAILELRLHRLTALERGKIDEELKTLGLEIAEYLNILQDPARLLALMKEELLTVKEKLATPRLTQVVQDFSGYSMEDLITREDMVVTLSHTGYIKRVPVSSYRAQRRGGKGRTGMSTREEDFVENVFVASTHTPLLFFTSRGMSYRLKVYELPLGNAQSRGKPLVNLLPITKEEKVTTILPLPEDEEEWRTHHIVFATSAGTVRRNLLSDFQSVRSNGKIAMKIEGKETLVGVATCHENSDILLTTRQGQAIRFTLSDVRVFVGRDSMGVRGIRLDKEDEVVSMAVLNAGDFTIEERDAYLKWRRQQLGEDETREDVGLTPERLAALQANDQLILVVSDKGFGKRTSAYEYRVTGRGGRGVTAMALSQKTGLLVSALPVSDGEDLVLVTDGGQLLRCPIHQIRIAGRVTQGVMLLRVPEKERIVAVASMLEAQGGDEEGEELEEGVVEVVEGVAE